MNSLDIEYYSKIVKEIEKQHKIRLLSQHFDFAVKYVQDDPSSSLHKSSIVLEKILLKIFVTEIKEKPKKPEVGFMLRNNQFTRKIDQRIISRMDSIRNMVGIRIHDEANARTEDALKVLTDLSYILEWYNDHYVNTISIAASAAKKYNKIEKLWFYFIILLLNATFIFLFYVM